MVKAYRKKYLTAASLIFFASLPKTTFGEQGESKKRDWQDKSQQFISNRADQLANWLDSFFHSDDYETETAESFFRLQLQQQWYQSQNDNTDISLRGKIHLPSLNERLTLIFNDEDDQQDTNTLTTDDNDTLRDISLQYNDIDNNRHRLDYRLGIRSNGALKSSIRYRYKQTHQTDHTLYFINKLRFRGDEGFENIMRYRHDIALDNVRILQYQASINYGEITKGVEWQFYPSMTKKLRDNNAVRYFGDIRGITRPDYLTREYGLGVNYRANLNKAYIFWELQPALYFRKNDNNTKRETDFRIQIGIEFLFD